MALHGQKGDRALSAYQAQFNTQQEAFDSITRQVVARYTGKSATAMRETRWVWSSLSG